MTVNEYLDLYKTGIEAEILSVDELEDFIYNEIERLANVPFCYIGILEAAPKGAEAVTKFIDDYFWEHGYVQQSEDGCLIERILIGKVALKYKNGEISMRTASEYLMNLSCYYDPYSRIGDIYYTVDNYYRWDYDFAIVENEFNRIFEMAVYDYL